MFGDTFETFEEQLNPITSVFYTKKARNCADLMELPELPRIKHFAGLKNQGATCYLNSLIQSYYMSPEFRNVILQLPLCKDNINDSANLAQNEGRNNFLLEFQKLFIKLQNLQARATSTESLTNTFKWNEGEQLLQQDVSEANKVLFETMDRALFGTQYKLTPFYKGILFNHITCLNCLESHGHEETYYDINIQVEGNKTLEEALFNLVNPFLLNEGNQYFCELCGFKVDAHKGVKIRQIPPILTLTLNRYSFDYDKMARIKLTDRFEFPLEIDMGIYLENEQQNLIYELSGIIIHRGNAHGGHYHAYYRDLLNEADWNSVINEYWNEKIEQQQQQQQQQQQDKEIDYDEIEFPQQYNNPKVTQNWFNFNDNSVIPIPVNKLQSQFQGSESAYILIYRDKKLIPEKLQDNQIPKYLINYVNSLNEIIEQERQLYEDAKNYINITISDQSIIDIENHKLLQEKFEKIELHLNINMTIEQLYKEINKDGYLLLEYIENYQTKLLHFPRILQNNKNITLLEAEINHDSTWILIKENQNILQVGIDKIPFRINLLINKKPQNYLFYSCTTLIELKQFIQSLTGINCEEQLLKNVQNQKIISDLVNETKLGELQLNLETQILVNKKSIQQQQQQQKVDQKEELINDDITTVLVEREEEHGTHRFYVNINSTLQELVEFIKEQLGLTDARRLRNLNGRQLFSKQDLPQQLKEFSYFREGGARLQIEKGEIPETGKISLIIRYKEQDFEIHCDPRNDKINKIKQESCLHFQIQENDFKLYKVDWLQIPTEAINEEEKLISSCYLRDRDILILCEKNANIDCELSRFQLFQTTTGYPDDCIFKQHEAIRKDSTLKELKEMIIRTFNLNIQIDYLRVRDIQKNRFFGQVYRKLDQQIRKMNFSTNDIVFQVLNKSEDLQDDEMLLLIKERDVKNRIYINQQEFIFKINKTPKIQELKDQISQYIGINQQQINIDLAKFIFFEFQWLHLDINIIKQQQEKSKQGKQTKKQNNDKGQKDIQDNLKKFPFNLQEGDFIGYRLGEYQNDDFQTKEDEELRQRMIAARKNKHNQIGKQKRGGAEPIFRVNIE